MTTMECHRCGEPTDVMTMTSVTITKPDRKTINVRRLCKACSSDHARWWLEGTLAAQSL